MDKPKKWTEIYPQGTKEGDEEAKFFRSLARHPKFDYRSVQQLVKESGLTRERVEEIIAKYANLAPPLVYPHPTNDDHWGYWERCEDDIKKDKRSLSQKDQDARINKHMGKDASSQCCGSGCGSNCGGDPGDDGDCSQSISVTAAAPADPSQVISINTNPSVTFGNNLGLLTASRLVTDAEDAAYFRYKLFTALSFPKTCW